MVQIVVWWELLCAATMWMIQKSRCQKVFEQEKTPPMQIIKEIWLEIISTLRGQLQEIYDHSNTVVSQRITFHRIWQKSSFYTFDNTTPRWNYTPPCFLYPPL
jgi:hypothetical protein